MVVVDLEKLVALCEADLAVADGNGAVAVVPHRRALVVVPLTYLDK